MRTSQGPSEFSLKLIKRVIDISEHGSPASTFQTQTHAFEVV